MGQVGSFAVDAVTFPTRRSSDLSGGQSTTEGPLHAGNYTFNATVAGNGDYFGATSSDAPLTINKAQLSITTTIHDALTGGDPTGVLGESVYDTAVVTGQVGSFAI